MKATVLLGWFCLLSNCGLAPYGWAQSKPRQPKAVLQLRQPEIDFDRRNDLPYMDSLLTLGRQNLYMTEKLIRTAHNDTLKLEALRYLTTVFKQTHHPLRDSSYIYAQRLFSLATTFRNNLYAVRALMQEEYYVRIVQGNYPKALDINRQAGTLCIGLKPQQSPLWQVKLNMGTIYFLLRDYPEALVNFRATLGLLPQYTLMANRNKQLFLSEATTRIGEIYEAQGQLSKAQRQYELSLKIAHETHSRVNIAYANEQLGDFYTNQQLPEQSITYYQEALHIWTSMNNETGQAAAWSRLAESYALMNRADSAIEFGEKALKVARQTKNSRIRQMSTLALYRAYRLSGNPLRALTMFEEYQLLRDSLSRRKQVDEMLAMQKKYDIDKVQADAERRQLIQRQELAEIRRTAELGRLQDKTDRWQLAADARAAQLQQHINTERMRAEAEQNRLVQKARINSLNHDIEQQNALRVVLLVGLLITLLFVGLITFNNRLINRQKRQIEMLNTGLEEKVQERTAELELANDQLRAKNREIADALLRGQTQERKRVAADLHDNLGGLLAAIKVSLSALDSERMLERERLIYNNLLTMTREAYTEIRHLSHNLQPEELEKQGLSEALTRLITKLNLTQRIQFSLAGDRLPTLDKNVEFQLYSICLELCNNILKHSHATTAAIAFRQAGDELIMQVCDNGRGIADGQTTGIGLHNIRERAAAMHGRMDVQTGGDEGTAFSFRLPLRPAIQADNSVMDA